MKGFRLLLGVCTVLSCCAWAQSAKKPLKHLKEPLKDPQVIVAGAKGSLPVGSLFSFVSPTGTSPLNLGGGSPCVVNNLNTILDDCIFQNGTGSKWTNLSFSISPSGQLGPFTCLALAFFSGCFFNRSGTQVTFFGGSGISPGDDFLIAVVLWLPHTSFSVTATLASSSNIWLRRQPDRVPLPAESPILALFLNGHVAADWRKVWALGTSRA